MTKFAVAIVAAAVGSAEARRTKAPTPYPTRYPTDLPEGFAGNSNTLKSFGLSAHHFGTLGECKGDCDYDRHCATGLKCFRRNTPGTITGCEGVSKLDHDYCYDPKKSEAYLAFVAKITAADEQKCKVINANDFSSLNTMVASGWTSTGVTHHHHAGPDANKRVGAGCSNGNSNWWGWKSGSGVGKMEIQAPMDSYAEIDVGNCWNAGTVRVYAAGTEILAAKVGEGSEKAYFSVKKGDLISVRDEGAHSIMRINSLKFYSCMADATAHVARTATEQCEAIEANDFSSIQKMLQVGWEPIGIHDHHHAEYGNLPSDGARCNTGDNWWGVARVSAPLVAMEIDSPVSSTATIDFGGCWTNAGSAAVKVYVDGKEVGSAAVGVGSKVVSFAVKKGERISVRDEGANSVMRLNSLTFASCQVDSCTPEFCSTWNCDMWCKCFEESTLTAVYESYNCFDDGMDTCECK